MPHYCTNCQINWARLESHDCDGDESYDVCPICKTDSFLDDGKEGDAFIQLIDGSVINPKTGEEYKRFPEVDIEKHDQPETIDFEVMYGERINREDEALEAYHQALSAGMMEDEAKEIYRAKMAKA